MKPHRLRMTHSLLLAYGMYKKMEVYRPHPAQQQELERFHSADYIQFLKRVTPDSAKDYLHQLQKFNLGPYTDCPMSVGQRGSWALPPLWMASRVVRLADFSLVCVCVFALPLSWDGMYDFCSLYAGGSIDGAMKLNHGLVDIAINWSGGLHHAKKAEASGQSSGAPVISAYVGDVLV